MATDPKSGYYDIGGVETIDIIKAKCCMIGFKAYLYGNLLKYICRLPHKDPIRDCEKIIIYTNMLKQELEQD